MTNALTDDQITILRHEYLSDVKEDRREWGSSVVVSASTAAGSATLPLSGLVGPALFRRTEIRVWAGGGTLEHRVTQDVAVAAGVATIAISPLLTVTVPIGSRVDALPYLKGTWARLHGDVYFSDDELQSMGLRALQRWGQAIELADDRDEALCRAVRLLAFERQRGDDDYLRAVIAENSSNLSEIIKTKGDVIERDRAFLKRPGRGGGAVNYAVTR